MGDQPTEAEVRQMLWEAFRAGIEQGSDEATAYDWGQLPRQPREDAFDDFMADWNPESALFRRMFPPAPTTGDDTTKL